MLRPSAEVSATLMAGFGLVASLIQALGYPAAAGAAYALVQSWVLVRFYRQRKRSSDSRATHRGHIMTETPQGWVYADTGRLVSEWPNRPCGHCHLPNRADGHDACLGELPGVTNACCGHGHAASAYIQTTVEENMSQRQRYERAVRDTYNSWAKLSKFKRRVQERLARLRLVWGCP